MEIPTALGIQWRMASASDIMTLIGILLIPVMILIFIRLYNRYRSLKIHDSQLFLFRLKRLGLSNFQIKIVNNLIGILRFSNPNMLLAKTDFFESAAGRFMSHLQRSGESDDSLTMICRDLAIIYDKLYYPTRLRMPLRSVQDVDENQLVCFTISSDKVFLGKITSFDSTSLYLKAFGNIAGLGASPDAAPVTFHLFRPGDAEYTFSAPVPTRAGNQFIVDMPQEILRGDESRHPYIDVIIPAEIARIGFAGAAEDEVKINCTIYKINEYEAVLRITAQLDYNYKYALEFNQLDFNFKIVSKIISQKTVEEGGIFYYTLKFEEISEGAGRVLKKYVYEHL